MERLRTNENLVEANFLWKSLKGSLSHEEFTSALYDLIKEYKLNLKACSEGYAIIYQNAAAEHLGLEIIWREIPSVSSGMQRHLFDKNCSIEILIFHKGNETDRPNWVMPLIGRIANVLERYNSAELLEIEMSMPLIEKFIPNSNSKIKEWAFIFRDHFLEHSFGFLQALIKSGVPPEWIYAFDKGDKTKNRHRIRATMAAMGIRTGLFDNTTIDAPESFSQQLQEACVEVDNFIDEAKSNGRKVMVIDDGGIVACGYASPQSPRRVDAALELTISGLKRISVVCGLDIPVLNLAKSELKQCLGYPEIVNSCLRRIHNILPGYKIIGQHIIVLGYGSLGEKLARAMREQGSQIHVVETDILRLIQAAEAGFSTFGCLSDALRQVKPFMIAGTSGNIALTPLDLPLLPDGVFLAPFATKDFSILTTRHFSLEVDALPTVGKRYRLDPSRCAVVLGDGRSMNIFDEDSIPNEGYDAYRAGTLIVADYVCSNLEDIGNGVQVDIVDEIIRNSGLYSEYYNRYLKNAAASPQKFNMNAVVVGYGVAGRMHARILADEGACISIVDPKFQNLPGMEQAKCINQLPPSIIKSADIWSVCTPTSEHLSCVREILKFNPKANIYLEKPACQANEINELIELNNDYPSARIAVVDQYSHTTVLSSFLKIIRKYEPSEPIHRIEIQFHKDRSQDIEKGRFVDRSYGVLGYEWLHMLSVLKEIMGHNFEQYISQEPINSVFYPIFNSSLFLSGLTEKTRCNFQEGNCDVVLKSNILMKPKTVLPHEIFSGSASPLWRGRRRSPDDRDRKVTLEVGDVTANIFLDPVTDQEGRQLPRNHHRILIQRDGKTLHDEIIMDSPLHNAIRSAIAYFRESKDPVYIDLSTLKRISSIASHLRSKAGEQQTLPYLQVEL
ncbi:Gfo/Idh/MocA family oxidoreductase [Dickeya dianthicola]|uniref:Gfo/Idh/MocA family oxidoreductase n=1 Tax=Dickeya dianthicola TaxID=204039 RepID=UPI0018681B24|nr:Gfo/Idh/MocA family oxidoreductase [Dickeya dianthicola]QOL13596.1 hypothetical protein HGI48_04770 [Dickeya dianthicola]